jgi:hypothetical protein
MSNYNDLSVNGKTRILDQLYKQLFGLPSGKIAAFNNEAPGSSTPNIYTNKIFSQHIPATVEGISLISDSISLQPPNNYTVPNTTTKQQIQTHRYIKKYSNVVLLSPQLAPNITYWFAGADPSFNSSNKLNQVTNNLLTQGIPPTYDPTGSYAATIYIAGDSYTLGNTNYPWVYNPNSGIVEFLGDSEYPKSNEAGYGKQPSNNTPNSEQIVTFSFWRYEGKMADTDIYTETITGNTFTTNYIGASSGTIGGVTFADGAIDATSINVFGVLTAGNNSRIGGVTFSDGAIGATSVNVFGVLTAGNNSRIGGVTFSDGAIGATGINSNNITAYELYSETAIIGNVGIFDSNIVTSGTITGNTFTGGYIGATYGNIGGVTFANGNIVATGIISGNTSANFAGITFENGTISANNGINSNNITAYELYSETAIIGNVGIFDSNIVTSGTITGNTFTGGYIGATGIKSNNVTSYELYSETAIIGNVGIFDSNIVTSGTITGNTFTGGYIGATYGNIGGVTFANGNIGCFGTVTATNFSGLASNATNVNLTVNDTDNIYYPTFAASGEGNKGLLYNTTTTALSYNPSTSTLTATNFSGLASNATNVNLTVNDTDNTYYPVFAESGAGSRPLLYDTTTTALSYKPDTSTLTSGSFNALSDYRIKENVQSIDLSDNNIDSLRPVIYVHKDSQQPNMGFIAHELQEHYPFLVAGIKDGPDTQSVNYIGLIGLLTKEIQQLKADNKDFKDRFFRLESQLILLLEARL